MKSRPILMSAPMVRAILDGTKTQTRRSLKHQPIDILPMKGDAAGRQWICLEQREPKVQGKVVRCRFGVPGDQLWVRETWQHVYEQADGQCFTEPREGARYKRHWIEYAATSTHPPPKWRPSIFMPRTACRIALEVIDVRVERLQAIRVADARAEGIQRIGGPTSCTPWRNYGLKPGAPFAMNYSYEVSSYESLWESINGVGTWKTNPWVWVVEFRRIATAKTERAA